VPIGARQPPSLAEVMNLRSSNDGFKQETDVAGEVILCSRLRLEAQALRPSLELGTRGHPQ